MLTQSSTPKTKVLRKKSEGAMLVVPEVSPEEYSHKFPTMPERIAQSHLFYRNHLALPLKEAFPEYPRLWIVDQYFPSAKCGPVYIDTIHRYWDDKIMAEQIKQHELRAKIMRKAGLRYVYIAPGMLFEEALSQLGIKEE